MPIVQEEKKNLSAVGDNTPSEDTAIKADYRGLL